jgi:hypothetical protein
VFNALPGLSSSQGTASVSVKIRKAFEGCSSPNQRSNSSSFEEAETGAFLAVSEFTNMASGKQFVSKFIQSILNFPGFSDVLSSFARTIPDRPASLTDQNGVSTIEFEFNAGSSGSYAVIFVSGSAVGTFGELLDFKNSVTDVSIAELRFFQPSNVTLKDKTAVFLPSFEKQTRYIAHVTTRSDAEQPIRNPPYKM